MREKPLFYFIILSWNLMYPIVPYSHSEAHLSGPTSSLTELALMVCLEQLSQAG